MKIIGFVLLLAGFIGASVATVWRLEVADDKWSTIPWSFYGLSMGVGIVGVVLLRWASQSLEQHSERVDAEYAMLTTSIATLVERVAELRQLAETEHPRQIVDFIDERCAIPFADFADARNAITKRHGLNAFAEIMTQFASGERFVNRAWSAAADGYLGEVRASLETAERSLVEAKTLLKALE